DEIALTGLLLRDSRIGEPGTIARCRALTQLIPTREQVGATAPIGRHGGVFVGDERGEGAARRAVVGFLRGLDDLVPNEPRLPRAARAVLAADSRGTRGVLRHVLKGGDDAGDGARAQPRGAEPGVLAQLTFVPIGHTETG